MGGQLGLVQGLANFAILVLQMFAAKERPRISQFMATVFGLFYCGLMPSFWVKLRLLAVPAVNTTMATHWPVALGGIFEWTIGLIATFMAVA